MTIPGLKPAYWADEVAHVENAAGNPLFKSVDLKWSKPELLTKDKSKPTFESDDPFVYAFTANFPKEQPKEHIVYIGLTANPKGRFLNHDKKNKLLKKHKEIGFSCAIIDFIKGRNRIERLKGAMEEIEHLLIWSAFDDLVNDKKMYTLPGMGRNRGNAWHIRNTGYGFSGRMPREIIYPWMLVKNGRANNEK